MTSKIDEFKADVEELNRLLSQASRQRVKDLLTLAVRKVQTEISTLEGQSGGVPEPTVKSTVSAQTNRCYEVKLNNYAWDQSDNFVKIFATLKNVNSLPDENVYTIFTDNSMELHMNGLDNRNYTLPIKSLLEKIDATKSFWKVKKDMVVVSLAKVDAESRWSHLTLAEKKAKEPKSTPKPNKDASDPTSSLMEMMKQMYEDGDDEMKRTIAKAWTENRNNPGGMPGF